MGTPSPRETGQCFEGKWQPTVSCAKTAEPIEMLLGRLGWAHGTMNYKVKISHGKEHY